MGRRKGKMLLNKDRQMQFTTRKLVYLHLSKVGGALLRLGHTTFKVEILLDHASITELPEKSPYSKIKVYCNGTIYYCDLHDNIKLEGDISNQYHTIMRTICPAKPKTV